MKMDAMITYLEKAGFKARRRYDTKREIYIFSISKDNIEMQSEFRYPGALEGAARDRIQRDWLNNFIAEFHRLKNTMSHSETLGDIAAAYMEQDMANTKNLYYGLSLTIKDVIFNPPATIVFWADGTKTVVKAQTEDSFDPEKGLAMAISKKALGNKYDYYNPFKKWVKKFEKKNEEG